MSGPEPLREEAMLEYSAGMVALVDATGAWLYASPATTRHLGYAVNELTGRNALDFVHPEDRLETAATLAAWADLRGRRAGAPIRCSDACHVRIRRPGRRHRADALAIAMSDGITIDLLVTDVVLPGMDGSALAEKVRRAHPSMKCIFISGYTGVLLAHRLTDPGEAAFLQKPFTVERLARCVRGQLSTLHE